MTSTKKTTRTRKTATSSKAANSSKTTTGRSRKRKTASEMNEGETVTIDRRKDDRRKLDTPVAIERRKKVNRRRQIDPTTCERDYSPDEIKFMNAMDEYKRANGRMFPTCSEVLEVIKKLGYTKHPMTLPTPLAPPTPQSLDAANPEPIAEQSVDEVLEPATV